MNSLAQLCSDLDLDEAMVMKRLKRSGLVPIDAWNLYDIHESECQPAIDLVMKVLRQDCERAIKTVKLP